MEMKTMFFVVLWNVLFVFKLSECNQYAKELYEYLLHRKGYNNIIRPVFNESDRVDVKIGLKLSQLIDVDEKNQIMTVNVWVLLEWYDKWLVWNPDKYGSVSYIYVPIESIWHPDIVLYNNADGNYQMTMSTKATLTYDGRVKWTPPALFKCSCEIHVLYFPFDAQYCEMKFGSWTYNKHEVEINHLQLEQSGIPEYTKMMHGIDMKDFYENYEWEVLEVPAMKVNRSYAGSYENFTEWTFGVQLKRRFLFYTVNLIIPLMSHAILTVLVFYLPSDSKQKIPLCISILLSLTVFFLMLAEIIPNTSVVVPLLGKYLLFTLVMVTSSIITTGITLNIHFRSVATHVMPDWVRKVFLYFLPKVLRMRRPKIANSQDVELKHIKLKVCACLDEDGSDISARNQDGGLRYQFGSKRTKTQTELMKLSEELDEDADARFMSEHTRVVRKAIEGAMFIANHLKHEDEFTRTKEDWKYVALVIDRVFLWIYTTVCFAGSFFIIFTAPMLWDTRKGIANVKE